jgi:hypothetical protein
MAIGIQYGPISSALGLAQQAGLAQRQRVVAGQDQAFIEMMQQAQRQADQQYAQEVSSALAEQQSNQNLQLHQQALQQQAAAQTAQQDYNTRHLAATTEAQAASNKVAQQNADTASDYRSRTNDLAEQKYQDRSDALDTLDPGVANMIRASGRLPATGRGSVAAGNNQQVQVVRLLQAEARRAADEIARYDKLKAQTLDFKLGKEVPDPADIVQKKTDLAKLNNEIQHMNQGLISAGPGAQVNTQAVLDAAQQNPQAVNPQAPQSAPDQQPRIVRVAVNQTTGERIGLTDTGQLVRLN